MPSAGWTGANGQLRKITSIQNMDEEAKLKITCCKHSAACTAVEQAADTGPMFKVMKRLLKLGDNPHTSNNNVLVQLEEAIRQLEDRSPNATGKVLNLLPHKKKAILATIPKLPSVTGSAFSMSIIKKGFIVNGQINLEQKLVPCLKTILHTYRGEVNEIILRKSEMLFRHYYEEMYTYGMINEESFDHHHVPMDMNADGTIFERNFNIKLENRQRAKVLSAKRQIEERKAHIFDKCMQIFNKDLQLFEAEKKEYILNKVCETKLGDILKQSIIGNNSTDVISQPSTTSETNFDFHLMSNSVTYELLNNHNDCLLNAELKAFVRVRSKVAVRGGRLTYCNVPNTKHKLMLKAVELRNVKVNDRKFTIRPIEPTP